MIRRITVDKAKKKVFFFIFTIDAFFLYEMHGTQKLSPLDPSAGIVTPPTHNHRLPYVCSLSTNLFRFAELPQLRRKKSSCLFYHTYIFPVRNAWNVGVIPPELLCRDCDTTYHLQLQTDTDIYADDTIIHTVGKKLEVVEPTLENSADDFNT